MDAAVLALCTGASVERARLFVEAIVDAMDEFDISTPQRQAAFLAQVGHESGNLSRLVENLNYSVDGLLATFGRHRISEADARKYGRTQVRAADQKAIANLVYGGAWGKQNLGNELPGDGWQFRGRGLKQLTGRDNYKRASAALGLDLMTRPELLETPVPAARSAAWFWSAHGCNALADAGEFEQITRVINGGLIGLDKRVALWNEARLALGVA